MDNDDNHGIEPSSSHILENVADNNDSYLPPDESSLRNNDDSHVYEETFNDDHEMNQSDSEEEHFEVEQSLFSKTYSESNPIDDADIAGSQQGCSSSSGSNANYNFFESSFHSGSEASPHENGYENDCANAYQAAGTSKQADSNYMLNSGKSSKGNKTLIKMKKLSVSSSKSNENNISRQQIGNNFVEPNSDFHLGNYSYDSDSSLDETDIVAPNHSISSPHSRNPRNQVSYFLNEDESFMVASSSEGLNHLNDIIHLRSPRTPGDSCLVSSSTGQLDSLPPTPLNFQGNDVSHSSAASSPYHPPVLDSTVDSTSGQNISSPYSMQSEDDNDEAEANNLVVNNSIQDERNEISTSVIHSNEENLNLPVIEDQENCDQQENNISSPEFVNQYLIDSINCMEVEASGLIQSSSAYNSESLAIPGTSGVSKKLYLPKNFNFIDSNSPTNCPGSESIGSDSINKPMSYAINSTATGAAGHSLNDSGLLSLELSEMAVESSNLVASSASLEAEEFTSANGSLNSDNDFNSSRTLTELNQHYSLTIGENSLGTSSVESVPESEKEMLSLDVRENLETECDGDAPSNIQASLELGLGPNQLRRLSNSSQEPQGLVPPTHLLEDQHIETTSSSVNLMVTSQSVSMGDTASLSILNHGSLDNEVINIPEDSGIEAMKEIIEENRDPVNFENNLENSEFMNNFYKNNPQKPIGVFEALLQESAEKPEDKNAKDPKKSNKNLTNNNYVNIHSLFGNKSTASRIIKPNMWPNSKFKELNPKSLEIADKFSQSLFSKKKGTFKVLEPLNKKNIQLMDSPINNIVKDQIKINENEGQVAELSSFKEQSDDMFEEELNETVMEITGELVAENESELLDSEPQLPVASNSTLNSIDDETYQNESGFWCSDCEKFFKQKCSTHRVQKIMDKPILSRAWASLPVQHLLIKQIPNAQNTLFGVFSRKFIPKRSQFGPLEGKFCLREPEVNYGLTFKCLQNNLIGFIDLSNEETSNWMRFVRPASSYLEINCVVIQQDENIYFLTTVNLQPKTELRVGYSKQYAVKYGFTQLTPTEEEQKVLEMMKKTWSCYECDDSFETSAQLQNHLSTHDKEKDMEKRPRKRLKNKRTRTVKNDEKQTKKIKGSDGSEQNDVSELKNVRNIYECRQCSLCFYNSELLKLHEYIHVDEATAENQSEKSCSERESAEKQSEKSCSERESAENQSEKSCSERESADNIQEEQDKICPLCSASFLTNIEIGEHVKQHSFVETSQNSFKCGFCYKSFSNQKRLNSHAEAHKNEYKKPFACRVCSRRFCKKSALGSHMKFHANGLMSFVCPICREQVNTISELKVHFPKHCVDGLYTCPTCLKKFPSYFQIRRHIRSYHSIIIPCPECGKEFPSREKLNTHRAIHSDKREFGCPVCPKRFKRKDKMKEHFKRMHVLKKDPKKIVPKFIPKVNPTDYKKFMYKCDHCLLGFKRRGMLVNHFNKRHPDIPISSVPELNQPILRTCRKYLCQYCQKTYTNKKKRNEHILKQHPGNEPPNLSSPLTDEENLSKTMKTYPASCPWCPRQYMTKAKLLQHQRKHHPGIIEANENEPTQEQKSSTSAIRESQVKDCDIPSGDVVANPVQPEDDILARALGRFTNASHSENGETVYKLNSSSSSSLKDGLSGMQQLQLSEPVVVNVNNDSPVLLGGTVTDNSHPYVLLTPESGESYAVSFRPGAIFSNVVSYPINSHTSSRKSDVEADLQEAGPSHNAVPIDMRLLKQRNSSNEKPEENIPQFSLDISNLKNDSCILAQVQSPVGAETSLVVCQPFLSFTQPTL